MNKVKMRLTVFFITLVPFIGSVLILFPEEAMAQSRATPSNATAPTHADPADIAPAHASPSDLKPANAAPMDPAMDDEIWPVEDEPTYKFSIRKVGADGMLDGAVFRLYHHLDDANEDRNPIYFMLDDGEPPLYTACPSSGCPASSDATKDITAGIAFMEGLPAGTYYLAEIAAPEGYQKLHYPYQIELRETGSVYYAQVMSGDHMTSAPGGQILIGNYAMVLMPGTGGNGAYLFYIAGAGCMLMALFMIFKIRRR